MTSLAVGERRKGPVKDFIRSKHMRDVFKQINDMSTAPIEFIWRMVKQVSVAPFCEKNVRFGLHFAATFG
jgi:hypothetical protein